MNRLNRIKWSVRAGVFAVALVVLSCLTGLDDVDWQVYGMAPLTPSLEYEEQYHQAEDCLVMLGDFSKVRWFLVDSLKFGGRHYGGRWVKPHDIYLLKLHSWEAVR